MTQDNSRSKDPGDKLREEAAKTGESLKSEFETVSQSAADSAKDKAEVGYEEGKKVAEDQLDTLSGAVGDAAERLQDEDHPLASYAGELSTQLGQLAKTIESKSLNDVASDAHRLARDNPALFMLGSVAVGFAASRFIKASDSRQRASGRTSTRTTVGGNASTTNQSAPGDNSFSSDQSETRSATAQTGTAASLSTTSSATGTGVTDSVKNRGEIA